jgi:hypothetical protein
MPLADTVRRKMGMATDAHSSRHNKETTWNTNNTATLSPNVHSPKSIIIKVQIPRLGSDIPEILVYTKKRDLVCTIRPEDNRQGYARLTDVVRTKGVDGLKAYFAAELKSKDELVVKISEVLAEQPF